MADVTVTQEEPERIYLQPRQCYDPSGYDGRQWCEDPVWPDNCGCDCERQGVPVCYVREDISATTLAAKEAELAAALAKVEKLRAALAELAASRDGSRPRALRALSETQPKVKANQLKTNKKRTKLFHKSLKTNKRLFLT